jgi:hypothetical protein
MHVNCENHIVYTRGGSYKQTINICPQGASKRQSNCICVVEFVPPFVTPEELRSHSASTVGDLIEWLTQTRGGTRRRTGQDVPDPSVTMPSADPMLRATSSPLIDPDYLPFTIARLRSHFAPSSGDDREGDNDRHLRHYLASARRYGQFCARYPDRRGLPVTSSRKPCQIQKDERFWIATCLMTYYDSDDPIAHLSKLLKTCFGEAPCVGDITSWAECLGRPEDLSLYFEANLPAPHGSMVG